MTIEQPKIDVRIPFEPEGRLGQDYNRIMNESLHDWVLLLDHDILLNTNPQWYYICQQSILRYPNTGMFTCKTNIHHKTLQYDETAPQSDTISEHQDHSKNVFEKFQNVTTIIPPKLNVSGFFMLISKEAWKKANGFPGEGMFKEDWIFTQKLHRQNIPIRLIDSLYVYHMRKRMDSWIEGVAGTKEIKAKEKPKK